MAWIHPGDNMVNDGSPYKFGPQMFMNHDVVLVSIQYRLGPFGFLRYLYISFYKLKKYINDHDEIVSMENDDAPGNLGLRDQALALEWIKKEGKNFCGNSEKITVFGSGSGGSSAMLQILTPLNKGKNLVQGAISQSGNLIDQSGLMKNNRRNITLEFAKSLGCKTNKVLL